MLDELFGETGGAIAQFVLALIVVLILILIVAWLLKKLGGGRFGATNSGQAELSIVDTLAIDPKRRLVLVRHGKLEHLLLIGGGSDEVVERSIVGGLPITARVQANKAPPPAPEKPAELPARPSSKFLDRLERTSAARKSSAAGSDSASTSAASEDKTASNDLATLGASVAAADAANDVTTGRSAYATMVAATSKAESKSAASTASEKATDKAPPKIEAEVKIEPAANPVPPTPLSAPEPIDLPPLPKPATLPSATHKPATPGSAVEPASPPTPPTGVSTPPIDRPLPKSEREALDQSLDAALHDSLLTPEPAKSDAMTSIAGAAPATVTPEDIPARPNEPATTSQEPSASPAASSADDNDMDFNLFDDGELEREMEAALASTSASPEASPELDAQSTAAIEAELAIDLMAPSDPEAGQEPEAASAPDKSSGPSASQGTMASPAVAPPLPVSDAPTTSEGDVSTSDDQAAASSAEDAPSADADKAEDNLPPYKDIPVELSRPDPVAIQIPSRGPAANATSVTKADNGITGEGESALPEGPSSPVDLSQLLETPTASEPATPESTETKPASGNRSDLDEEMRRLLGEIAGDPKAN